VIYKIRHTQSKKERIVHVGELNQQQNEHPCPCAILIVLSVWRMDDSRFGLTPNPVASYLLLEESSTIRIGHKDVDKDGW